MKLYIAIIIISLIWSAQSYSQCGCSGAPIGGAAPLAGTAGLSTQGKGKIYAMTYFRFSYGDTYFSADVRQSEGYINNMSSSYLGLLVSYGIFRDLSLEAEAGYFIRKNQVIADYDYWTSGLSHLGLSAKYNIYSDISSKFHVFTGLGLRAPLNNFSKETDNTSPQHLKTSSGAFGVNASFMMNKGFTGTDFNLFLTGRYEYNTENYNKYRYGNTLFASLSGSKKIFSGLSGFMELRNEYRMTDTDKGIKGDSTGSYNLLIVPALGYKSGIWNLSAGVEIPLYKYFKGSQLSNSYGANLMLFVII